MRITPRKEEIAPVVEILESDDYASGEAMAKALIKLIADNLWMRDWYALGFKFREDDPFWLPYGPFSSEADAIATAKKYGPGGIARTVKLYSPGRLIAMRDGKKGWPGYCADCGCDPAIHLGEGSGRGKCMSCPTCKKFKR